MSSNLIEKLNKDIKSNKKYKNLEQFDKKNLI